MLEISFQGLVRDRKVDVYFTAVAYRCVLACVSVRSHRAYVKNHASKLS